MIFEVSGNLSDNCVYLFPIITKVLFFSKPVGITHQIKHTKFLKKIFDHPNLLNADVSA